MASRGSTCWPWKRFNTRLPPSAETKFRDAHLRQQRLGGYTPLVCDGLEIQRGRGAPSQSRSESCSRFGVGASGASVGGCPPVAVRLLDSLPLLPEVRGLRGSWVRSLFCPKGLPSWGCAVHFKRHSTTRSPLAKRANRLSLCVRSRGGMYRETAERRTTWPSPLDLSALEVQGHCGHVFQGHVYP